MDSSCYLALIVHFITSAIHTTELNVRNKRAFELAQIESDLVEQERILIQNELFGTGESGELRDKICQDKCDRNLRFGLEMIKTHKAFGSINVPPLIDESDLKLFCELDDQHNWCLNNCGFAVQFNMNDFICKHHYNEMAYLLPCYRYAVPTLTSDCGKERCGPYLHTNESVSGRAHRCHLLLCDIKCVTNVLIRQCANEYGQRAAHFLVNYTNQQVSFWLQELNVTSPKAPIPSSCVKLFCSKRDLRECFL